jgi:GTP:adenosylcobinamide-phosphate guanylyltransferase
MESSTTPFTAIILAGDRAPGDPLAEAAGVACKSFVPVGGRSMVLRVLDTLDAAGQVGARILCGPSQALIKQEPELDASINLVTTADHALLSARIVDYFCAEARRIEGDVVVGLTPYEGVVSAFPETKRTAIKFKDGVYSGCNLFGFLNPRAHRAAQFWRQIEQERKRPLKMMRILGWWAVVRYLMGRTSLDQGLEQISHKLQIRARAVLLPFPEAAVDVDTADDWHFVQSLVKKQAF